MKQFRSGFFRTIEVGYVTFSCGEEVNIPKEAIVLGVERINTPKDHYYQLIYYIETENKRSEPPIIDPDEIKYAKVASQEKHRRRTT